MLIDTHTHLYLDEFRDEQEAVVNRALDVGVGKLIFPNVDLATIAPMRNLQRKFPNSISMAMGLHPTEVKGTWENDLSVIEDEFEKNADDYIAVGEIGIDLYWDQSFREEQMEVFSRQIDMAVRRNIPIIIHCRDGLAESLEVLSTKLTKPNGVFHSFGGTVEDVEAIREIGDFYFGINGIVTFKNSRLSEVLPEIGIDRIVLETDSPYLAPVPLRGKRNESAYIVNTARRVAEILGTSEEDIAKITTANAKRLFAI